MKHLLMHWRLLVVGVLLAAPAVVLVGLGMYHVWASGMGVWLWWPLTGCFLLAVVLGVRWQRNKRLLRVDFTAPLHWTERDRAAWKLVEARANQVGQLKPEQLTSIPFFLETAQSMAQELAQAYHPGAADPVGALTIPEILAVVELAAHDLAAMVDEYIPGGHLLSINDLRRIKQVVDWYPTASNISWIISGIFSPINTAARYFAAQAGNKPWRMLQDNIFIWFFTAYVNRLGSYLIEVNSGRLRVGAQRYLALKQKHDPRADGDGQAGGQTGVGQADDAVRSVTFVVAGQAKAGKSSLINAFLGEARARTDVLPATSGIERYALHPPGTPTRFNLLDTVGYGNQGPREDQLRATEEAVRNADVILLVLHARNPARQADVNLIEGLHRFFARNPDLREPPMLAVLTHIDLLSPAMEWSPPYDWQHPNRPKEAQIAEAVAAANEQLGAHLAGVIPVCTAAAKIFGIDEYLLPALATLLDQAHAVSFLRCLKGEIDMGKVKKVFHQLLAAGKHLVKVALASGR